MPTRADACEVCFYQRSADQGDRAQVPLGIRAPTRLSSGTERPWLLGANPFTWMRFASICSVAADAGQPPSATVGDQAIRLGEVAKMKEMRDDGQKGRDRKAQCDVFQVV